MLRLLARRPSPPSADGAPATRPPVTASADPERPALRWTPQRWTRFRDPETGLVSAELFLDRLEHARRRAARTAPMAVLLVAIDDAESTAAAEEAAWARDVARRLAAVTRAEDTVARLGRREFAVLLEHAELAALATAAAERVVTALDGADGLAARGARLVRVGVTSVRVDDGVDDVLARAHAARAAAGVRGASAVACRWAN